MKNINKICVLSVATLSLLNPFNTNALTKSETVYSKLSNTGSVKETVINTKLSKLDNGEIVDYSSLENIKNINGKEKFSKDSEKITWKSTGKDIIYSGTYNEELPIKVEVKYYLDGEETKIKDLKNKNGHIKIEYNFKNLSYDKNTNMYTPFVVTTSTIINTKDNSNVEVSSGKVVDTGTQNIVTGISSPGLYESTNISEFKDLDTIILEYDTAKFTTSDVYFVISPKLLSEIDLSQLDKVDNLNSSLNLLQDSMNKLEEGTKTLNDGSKVAYDASVQLSDGSNQLLEGINSLDEGLSNAIEGSSSITSGLKQINASASSISTLNTMVDKLYSEYTKNEELLKNINNGTTKQQLETGITEATSKKSELENNLSSVNAGITQLEYAKQAGIITEEQIIQLETLKNTKEQLEAGIKAYQEGITKAQNDLALLPAASYKIAGADEVISTILTGILGVDSMDKVNDTTITMFKGKMNALTSGLQQLEEGSNTLTEGLKQAKDGSEKLVQGNTELNKGTNELSNGLKTLYEGTTTLSEGTTKLNNEGIKQLSGYGQKAVNIKNKVKQLQKLSDNYKGFASTNSDSTVFIYKISK